MPTSPLPTPLPLPLPSLRVLTADAVLLGSRTSTNPLCQGGLQAAGLDGTVELDISVGKKQCIGGINTYGVHSFGIMVAAAAANQIARKASAKSCCRHRVNAFVSDVRRLRRLQAGPANKINATRCS